MSTNVVERSTVPLRISDIKPGMRGVTVAGLVTRKEEPYEISTRYGPAMVCDAEIRDSSGAISWRLWRDQIRLVNVDDKVIVENGFVRSFGEQLELNLGRDGKVTLLERRIGE